MVSNSTKVGDSGFLNLSITQDQLEYLPGTPCKKVNIFMGHHGWNDKTFIGKVYPPKTKKMDFLKQYALKFNSVLATSTRFALPSENEIREWNNVTPINFKFSVLAPQYLSHAKDFTDDAVLSDLDSTLNRLSSLNGKLAFLYFNFPSAVGPKRADAAIEFLGKIPNEFPLAVSFRNQKLAKNKSLYNSLAELNISSVLVDNKSHHQTNLTLTNNNLLVHFHGLESYNENKRAIEEWANKCSICAESGIENIYFFATQQAPNKSQFPELLNEFKTALIDKLGTKAKFI